MRDREHLHRHRDLCHLGAELGDRAGQEDPAVRRRRAQRRDVDGLATDGACGTNTCAVFAGAAVHDGVDGYLDGVLVGHDVDLESISIFVRNTPSQLVSSVDIQSQRRERRCARP